MIMGATKKLPIALWNGPLEGQIVDCEVYAHDDYPPTFIIASPGLVDGEMVIRQGRYKRTIFGYSPECSPRIYEFDGWVE